MKFTRQNRILFEFFGPPLVATILILFCTLLMSAWTAMSSWNWPSWGSENVFTIGSYTLLLAFVFAGIPSIVFTSVLEWRFDNGLSPKSWQTVWLAALLGFLSGISIVIFIDWIWKNTGFDLYALMGGLGLIVGLIMGLLIKWWSNEKKTRGEAAR